LSEVIMGWRTRDNEESRRNRKLVAAWLLISCFMVWVMVGIGGYTRDSGSGLSIMDWDPIIGTLPPLSQAAWNQLFALYKTIPQYQILHQGMDLAGFKALFWPEYFHRLWGRLIGVEFFVPLVVFIATRRVEARLIPWLLLLFVLGGLQGAVGWFMVASGFDPNSVAVQPWRLSLHFSFAIFLYIALFWTALTVLQPEPVRLPGLRGIKIWAVASILCVGATMFAGTFVSGTHAVSIFDPAKNIGMGAPPPGYLSMNMFADKAAVLFNHQALATLTVLVLLTTVTVTLRSQAPKTIRDAGLLVGALVMLQFILGVTALVSQMFDIGVAHQMDAVLLLTACLLLLHRLRGAVR
jgi:heme a synthase